jgi:pyridoxamine 5'-phosphate oxidase
MSKITEKIRQLRTEYARDQLDENGVDRDPFGQFGVWFDQAMATNVPEPHAMTLATCGANGQPSARIVLLKGFDHQGFVFFTNYESSKGQALAENPRAGLCFYWLELERQVRIEGNVEKLSPAASDEYFHSRPRESRIGAWASPQSRVLQNRAELEGFVQTQYDRFGETALERPPHWGGYLVRPVMLEFWQGRPSRLHDRIRYRLVEDKWVIERLAP